MIIDYPTVLDFSKDGVLGITFTDLDIPTVFGNDLQEVYNKACEQLRLYVLDKESKKIRLPKKTPDNKIKLNADCLIVHIQIDIHEHELQYILSDHKPEIKFVDYTGKYPNLCSGILTIKVDAKQYQIGPYALNSGGNCGFYNNYKESYVNKGKWSIDKEDIPEEIVHLKDKIEDLVNDNVSYGCCGSCL